MNLGGRKGDLRVISSAVREWTPGEGTENAMSEMDDRQDQRRAGRVCLWGLVTARSQQGGRAAEEAGGALHGIRRLSHGPGAPLSSLPPKDKY